MNEEFGHRPVLLNEVLDGLSIQPQGKYVDGTFGRGGHADEILKRLDSQGRLMVLDKDPSAVEVARQKYGGDSRVIIVRDTFANLKQIASEMGWFGKVNGVLLDLGVSSPQLDDSQRGFSFRRDGALDMRMDPEKGKSAAEWLATVSEKELTTVLRDYGEERYAKRIARAIVKARESQKIDSTRQLASIIAQANPKWEQGKDPATRSFQAIRIYVNSELDELQKFLSQVVGMLAKHGRLAIISFHSLEDRMVKLFIREEVKGDQYPAGLPVKAEQLNPSLRAIGKAIKPSKLEVSKNPRSRSSVLRIAEKL